MKAFFQALEWIQKKSPLLLILPLVHLLICFFYLSIYFYFFANHLSTFAAADDVFSVSFSKIVPFYLSVIFWFSSNNFDFESTELSPLPKGWSIKVVATIVLLTIVYLVAMIIAEFNRSGYVMIVAMWLATFLFLAFVSEATIGNSTKGFQHRAFLVIWLVTSLSFTAALRAQQDRFASFASLSKNYPTCREYPIVNKLGDTYLVVTRDNSRYLANAECELVVKISGPNKRPYPDDWKMDFWPF